MDPLYGESIEVTDVIGVLKVIDDIRACQKNEELRWARARREK